MRKQILVFAVLLAVVPRFALAESVGCPLADRNGYQELFNAINTLGTELDKMKQDCKDAPADMGRMLQAQEQLRSSAVHLQQYWQDPALAANDSAVFAQQLTQAINGVNSIGENLSNSTLANSACGQKLRSNGKVLLAVNDVVSNLAPLALLAGTLTGGVAAAVPYVLGVAGVTSVFKVLTNFEKNKIDIDNPEIRQVILKGTCEYTKIDTRLRYLTLMQSGKQGMTELREELLKKDKELDKTLEGFPQLKQRVNQFKERTQALKADWESLSADRSQYEKDNLQFKSLGAVNESKCGFALEMLEDVKPGTYPLSVAERAARVAIGSKNKGLRSTLLGHAKFERDLVNRLPQIRKLEGNQLECGNNTAAWLDSLGRVLTLTQEALGEKETTLIADLRKENGFSKWSNLEGERLMLEKLIKFMSVRDEPGEAINRSELDKRTKGLKLLLFHGRSPVGAWISSTLAMYDWRIKSFKTTYWDLDGDLVEMMIKPLAPGDPVKETRPLAKLTKLQILTAEKFPKTLPNGKSENPSWKKACKSLSDALAHWEHAQNHLDAADEFCHSIEKVITDDMDGVVVKTCVGTPSVNPTLVIPRGIDKLRTNLQNGRYAESVKLVQEKQAELKCDAPSPDASDR